VLVAVLSDSDSVSAADTDAAGVGCCGVDADSDSGGAFLSGGCPSDSSGPSYPSVLILAPELVLKTFYVARSASLLFGGSYWATLASAPWLRRSDSLVDSWG